jgi:thiol-disulfide isomerase/thioredoxin
MTKSIATILLIKLSLFFSVASSYSRQTLNPDGKINTHIAYITVEFEDTVRNGSITLIYWNNGFYQDLYYGVNSDFTATSNADQEKKYKFRIPVTGEFGYFSLLKKQSEHDIDQVYLLNSYVVEPGDEIDIKFKPTLDHPSILQAAIDPAFTYLNYFPKYNIFFNGEQSKKYKARYYIDSTLNNHPLKDIQHINQPIVDILGKNFNNYHGKVLEGLFIKIDSINLPGKNRINEVIKADLLSQVKSCLIRTIGVKLYSFNLGHGWYDNNLIDTITFYKSLLMAIKNITTNDSLSNIISEYGKSKSKEYSEYIIKSNKLTLKIDKNNKTNLYFILKDIYKHELRDKLLTLYLYENNRFLDPDLMLSIMSDANSTIKSEYFRYKIENLRSTKGQTSYPFILKDVTGSDIKQTDFLGKTVFIDFWFTGCGACIKYYQESLSEVEERFKNDSTVAFITVSIDRDSKIWRNSVASGIYTSCSAINLYTNGDGRNSPVIQYYNVGSCPHPLLIDRKGKIYANSGLRVNAKRLIDVIRECQEAGLMISKTPIPEN